MAEAEKEALKRRKAERDMIEAIRRVMLLPIYNFFDVVNKYQLVKERFLVCFENCTLFYLTTIDTKLEKKKILCKLQTIQSTGRVETKIRN